MIDSMSASVKADRELIRRFRKSASSSRRRREQGVLGQLADSRDVSRIRAIGIQIMADENHGRLFHQLFRKRLVSLDGFKHGGDVYWRDKHLPVVTAGYGFGYN